MQSGRTLCSARRSMRLCWSRVCVKSMVQNQKNCFFRYLKQSSWYARMICSTTSSIRLHRKQVVPIPSEYLQSGNAGSRNRCSCARLPFPDMSGNQEHETKTTEDCASRITRLSVSHKDTPEGAAACCGRKNVA